MYCDNVFVNVMIDGITVIREYFPNNPPIYNGSIDNKYSFYAMSSYGNVTDILLTNVFFHIDKILSKSDIIEKEM